MKLLHIISSTDPNGGGPIEGIKQIAPHLKSYGVSVEIASCDPPNAAWLSRSDFTIHALGSSLGKYRYSPKLLAWLKLNVHQYDAVVINGLWQYHAFAAWRVLAHSPVPYFVFTHGMLDPWFKYRYPLKHLKKWLYWPWADYRLLRDARAVVFTCEDERILARQSFWLYQANEAVTSYGTSGCPVKLDGLTEKFLDSYPNLIGKRVILFLGRIHEKKGCDLLMEAFAQVAHLDENLHLVMAGPDQTGWAATLKSIARQLKIEERVTWTDMLQGDTKWGAYYASEVFCLPSHQENFGIVVAEALACGKPVLISNKVNIWREIELDGAGFVDEDNLEGTVRNLKRWLALDTKNYALMATKSRECFQHRFHIEKAAERLLEIIRENSK